MLAKGKIIYPRLFSQKNKKSIVAKKLKSIISITYSLLYPFFSSYTMMRSCWENEPKDRPNFADLVTQISSLLEEIKNYLPLIDTERDTDLDTNSNGNDCNIPPVNDSESNFEKEEKH